MPRVVVVKQIKRARTVLFSASGKHEDAVERAIAAARRIARAEVNQLQAIPPILVYDQREMRVWDARKDKDIIDLHHQMNAGDLADEKRGRYRRRT